MAPRCYQSLENGQRCNAPAIHGSKFCRHHDPQRPKQVEAEPCDTEPLELPPLLDKPSMLVAVNQVAQALAAGRIKRSVAFTLLSCIKLATRLVTEIAEAGATGLPAPMPARQSIDRQSLLELDELVDIMQTGTPDQFREHFTAMQKIGQKTGHEKGPEQSKFRSPAQPCRQEITRLAASGDTQKPVQAFSLSDQPTDRFVEEMMAQAHELLAASPKPDPRFLRA